MTREDAEAFAVRWAESWNDGGVEAVLEHFRDDIVFTSPTALDVVGSSVVNGKDALRAYWTEALRRSGGVHFMIGHVLWDPVRRELAIIYTADISGRTRRVSENLQFDETGLVAAAEVFHGVTGRP